MTEAGAVGSVGASGTDDHSEGAGRATRRLGRPEVAHVARLARLALTDDELDLFTGQLGTVLAHAADVASLDLSAMEPTAHPLPIDNVMRADEPCPNLDRDELLAAAPDVEDHRFRVPRIVDAP